MATETVHIPVLLDEVLEHLALTPGQTVLDATVGGGGHALAISEKIGSRGTLIGLDQDTDALDRSRERLKGAPCQVILRESNFRHLGQVLDDLDISAIDGALFDLGWSSDQIADPERGMSFQFDGPLTMTLKKKVSASDVQAFDVVNHWEEATLADILYGFGDERYARRIAKGIVEARSVEPIRTTFELVEVIKKSVPSKYRNGHLHPATRTFQALRIVVNQEYEALSEALESVLHKMKTGGRLAVISFHSGEDRIVKRFFKEQAMQNNVRIITKKPISATALEISNNRRSRSAKLRVVEKI